MNPEPNDTDTLGRGPAAPAAGETATPAPASAAGSDTGPAAPADGPSYLTHREIIQVMIGLMAGMFLAALDQSIVGTALPSIVSDLGGLEHLSWVVTAYLLTSTASTPLWGKISDLYGRRPMFQLAIVRLPRRLAGGRRRRRLHVDAHRRPRDAGPRRRRSDGAGAGHHRRHHPAA